MTSEYDLCIRAWVEGREFRGRSVMTDGCAIVAASPAMNALGSASRMIADTVILARSIADPRKLLLFNQTANELNLTILDRLLPAVGFGANKGVRLLCVTVPTKYMKEAKTPLMGGQILLPGAPGAWEIPEQWLIPGMRTKLSDEELAAVVAASYMSDFGLDHSPTADVSCIRRIHPIEGVMIHDPRTVDAKRLLIAQGPDGEHLLSKTFNTACGWAQTADHVWHARSCIKTTRDKYDRTWFDAIHNWSRGRMNKQQKGYWGSRLPTPSEINGIVDKW